MPLISRRLVLKERGSAPVLGELELADPGPGEALVRMVAAGLCHTDLTAIRDARATPLVLGHEGAGIIEQLGAGVDEPKPGTPVLLCWKPPCGTCSACARGAVDHCRQPLETPTDRVSWNGRPISRLLGTGCFSERVLVPARALVPLPDTSGLEQAALIGCAVATGLGAVLRTAGVRPGSSTVVFGAGGVGLNVILGCALAQASTIIAIDPSDERLDLARQRGATHCTAPALATELVDTATHGQGVDYAFEVVGEPSVMRQALATLGRGGKLTLVGAAARDAILELRPCAFMSMQQQIAGCIYGSIKPHADLPLFISWWQDGKIPLADLVGPTIPLDLLPQAFTTAADRHPHDRVVPVSPSRLAELSPQELGQQLEAGAPLLVPIGTIEWHSHHLPLGLDGIKAEALAGATADRCHGLLAPTSWWAAGGVAYPYTLRLPADLITPLLTEVLRQYIGFGFQTITIVNGHCGLDNSIAVRQAALSASENGQALVLPVADYEALLALGARGDHAGVWETSLLWAARPDLVVTDALAPGHDLPGVIGEDPRGRASAELGAAGIETAAEQIATATSRATTMAAEQRLQFRDALRAGLDALHVLKQMRLELPRAEVPPVATATWLSYLDAFLAGRYEDAIRHAVKKVRDPAS